MLTKAQERLIRSLRTKKGREATGLCLIEGLKSIETAGDAVEFRFTRNDTPRFDDLVTTETPQDIAAVARIPTWTHEAVFAAPTVVVLDGVQDPGNVGSILRLGLGFGAALLLVDSADPASPKVVRSSAGAMFAVPWIRIPRDEAVRSVSASGRRVFRLERTADAKGLAELRTPGPAIVIAGAEGGGITIPIDGTPIAVPHDDRLESLNVGHALAIALHARYRM